MSLRTAIHVSLPRVRIIAIVGVLLSTLMLSPQAVASSARPGAAVITSMDLPDGRKAVVYNDGLARVQSGNAIGQKEFMYRTLPDFARRNGSVALTDGMPDKGQLMRQLMQSPEQPFVANRVIVVFRSGVTTPQDSLQVPSSALHVTRSARAANIQAPRPPVYTNDFATNITLQRLGVDRADRLFKAFSRSGLLAMRANTQGGSGEASINIGNAYRLHVTATTVRRAVEALLKAPSVLYASPDWRVGTMQSSSIALPANVLAKAASRATVRNARLTQRAAGVPGAVPSNYALTSSAQSLLNAPGDNAQAAYGEIQSKFRQLPGQGEIITNVSLGDLDDVGAKSDSKDPCNGWATVYGQTTTMIGGQRYIDWPSMPLIPAYVADANGNLSGSAEACGEDANLVEVGLDFSMMASLPHDRQRAGKVGLGLTDLLGVAPGAQYRLVVPAGVPACSFCGSNASSSDIDAALLAAATQTPRPNVITASLGLGYDVYGFSGRYLEDDPLTEAVVAAIVRSYNIVVCISAGDGTRQYGLVSIGPSGGSVPTERIDPGGMPTNLSDVAFSTVPSRDFDSGSVDVGGTTLDDIFAAPPQYPQFANLSSQHAFAETRWTGLTTFSSGFGSRVNVSAPSDNVLALSHPCCFTAFDAVQVNLEGGTSASAPETAAAAAIALQVARLTGNPIGRATDVRDLLVATGTQVPAVPQSDVNNFVGPQINVGHLVEYLVSRAGQRLAPSVDRVAVEQRRDAGGFDSIFLSDTDPTAIDLKGPASSVDGSNTDMNERAWITIAPDWQAVPAHTRYQLFVTGAPRHTLATTPWARLLPAQILAAAGLPLVSSTNQTVNLTYRAGTGAHPLAEVSIPLTFGPSDSTTQAILAPVVPSVVSGPTMHVQYDLTAVRPSGGQPQLVVSEPGHITPGAPLFRTTFTTPLSGLKGAVDVPVSALDGGGIYGVAIAFGPVSANPNDPLPPLSDFAFTRVAPTGSNRPPAPLLSVNGSPAGHSIEIPFGTPFNLSWNVSNVAGANGAILEVSAPGPNLWYVSNPFNNPNGSLRDQNGYDTGSEYFAPLNGGASGTATIDPLKLNLDPAFNQVVRILPTAGGRIVGEAGDVSSIVMDGVVPADGGFPNNGFAVNADGGDGFVTSGQLAADGSILSSVDSFDQATNAITHTAVTGSPNGDLYFTMQNGVLGPDVGFFGDENNPNLSGLHTVSYSVLNPISNGAAPSAWTPPIPYPNNGVYGGIQSEAFNNSTSQGVFLAAHADPMAPLGFFWDLFQSNVGTNTSGPVYDVSSEMGPCGNNACFNFTAPVVENPATNMAILGLGDEANANPPRFVSVDLATGKSDTFNGLSAGGNPTFLDMAVDSSTNKLAVATELNGLEMYDLSTHQGSFAALPRGTGGNLPECIAVDEKRHSVIVLAFDGGDLLTNNNALSAALIYDEGTNLLHTQEKFNDNFFIILQGGCLQLNPGRNSGYAYGPGHQQLVPFKYR